MSFLGGVENSNDGFWPCEGSGLARISGLLVDDLIMLARHFLCLFWCISATKKLAQPCNLMSVLQSCGLPPFLSLSLANSTLNSFVSTHDTTSLIQMLRFSILFGKKLYMQLEVLQVV